jgi:hypothetical protein
VKLVRLTTALVGVCAWGIFLGCNRPPKPRAKELVAAPIGSQPGASRVRLPDKVASVESELRDPLGRPIRVACVTCHSLRTPQELPAAAADLDEFHKGLSFSHGNLTCATCHVIGKQDTLRLADGRSIAMADAMTLCSQCHGPQRRAYDRGAHGGMLGHWDIRTGDRQRNNCVDCHDPHAPAYPSGRPVSPPRDRGIVQAKSAGQPAPGGHDG